MVGAVGIENNTDWNFKDLEEMLRSAKALKRNDRESNEILIGPSMAPRFFYATEIPSCGFFAHCPRYEVGFGPKFRGADGKPTTLLQERRVHPLAARTSVGNE
jgi:hypothetical protein